MRESDYDTCECGDYRHQHEDDWRGCTICGPNDGMNGRECLMFRLHEQARITWKAVH
jgi:hypothetical protein